MKKKEAEESNIIFVPKEDFDFEEISNIGPITDAKLRERGKTTLKDVVDSLDELKFLSDTQKDSILQFWEEVGF